MANVKKGLDFALDNLTPEVMKELKKEHDDWLAKVLELERLERERNLVEHIKKETS